MQAALLHSIKRFLIKTAFSAPILFGKALASKLLLASFFSISIFAQEKGNNFSQLQLCWRKLDSESTTVQPLVKNEQIFLPQNDGSLQNLSAATGETLWRSNLGGEIVGQIAANDQHVFVQTKIHAAENKESSLVVRALSLATGLTVWQKEFLSASQMSFALSENSLLIAHRQGVGNQIIKALDKQSGELLWQQSLPSALTTFLMVKAQKLYFATSDDYLRIWDVKDGAEFKRFRLPHRASERITIGNNVLFVNDSTGYVSSIREVDGKALWTLRLGGAVQQVLPTSSEVLLSSLDNFVYFHNALTGKRYWRRRLENRPLGASLVADKAFLLTISGQTSGSLFSLEKGKPIGQISFVPASYPAFSPLFAGQRLIIIVDKGVLAFSQTPGLCSPK